MVELVSADAASWINWVRDFDRTYGLFQQSLSRLRSQQQYVFRRQPQLANRYQDLYARGMQLSQQLSQLKQQRDKVAGWLNSIGQAISNAGAGTLAWLRNNFGLGGCSCDADDIAEQLGVAPVVVAVGVVAAAAVLLVAARWITETVQLDAQIREAQRLEARGLSSQEAARIAQGYGDEGALIPLSPQGVFGIPWPYVGVGVAALLVLPALMRRRA